MIMQQRPDKIFAALDEAQPRGCGMINMGEKLHDGASGTTSYSDHLTTCSSLPPLVPGYFFYILPSTEFGLFRYHFLSCFTSFWVLSGFFGVYCLLLGFRFASVCWIGKVITALGKALGVKCATFQEKFWDFLLYDYNWHCTYRVFGNWYLGVKTWGFGELNCLSGYIINRLRNWVLCDIA